MLLVVGGEGETNETIDCSISQMEKIKQFAVGPSIMTIYPGTALHREVKVEGFVNDSFWLSDLPDPFNTREHDLETLLNRQG